MTFMPSIIYFSETFKNIHNKFLAALLSNGYLNRLTNYGLIDNMGELPENCFMSHKMFILSKFIFTSSYTFLSSGE